MYKGIQAEMVRSGFSLFQSQGSLLKDSWDKEGAALHSSKKRRVASIHFCMSFPRKSNRLPGHGTGSPLAQALRNLLLASPVIAQRQLLLRATCVRHYHSSTRCLLSNSKRKCNAFSSSHLTPPSPLCFCMPLLAFAN